MKLVWAEINELGLATAILDGRSSFLESYYNKNKIERVERKKAIKQIRHQIFIRSGGHCERCGRTVTENGPENKGDMHEEVWRGREGEISLANSKFVCYKCHRDAHKSRNPQWSRQ